MPNLDSAIADAKRAGLWVTDKRWRWALAIWVAGLVPGLIIGGWLF